MIFDFDMVDQPPLEALREATPTPIAQLSPDNVDTNTRVVDGVVTITWPYSIVTKSIAFILAEHDVLLRRNQGQLRVQFHGASGRALADARIGGGDKLRISLEGAQWTKNDAKAGLPAGSLEWQLNFTNRLLATICRDTSQESEVLDIDAFENGNNDAADFDSILRATSPIESLDAELGPDTTTPKPQPLNSTILSKRLASDTFNQEEYASPAFIKRARVSYGSLFEGDTDLFGDEKSNKRQSRRKSRFSMGNAAWRYSSRSPSPDDKISPEPESPHADSTEETVEENNISSTPAPTPQRSIMVDEGCQTQDLQFISTANIDGSAQTRFLEEIAHESPIPAYATERGASTQTPSRTLFGQLHSQDDLSKPFIQPMDSQIVADDSYQHFGHGLPMTQSNEASHGFQGEGPAMVGLMSSAAPVPEVIAAAEHPDMTMADHIYPDPEEAHDPNLQFLENAHEKSGMFHPTSRGEKQWQVENTSTYPLIPDQTPQEPSATIIERSPPPEERDDEGRVHHKSPSEVGEDSESELPLTNDAAIILDPDAEKVEEQQQSEESDSDDQGGDLEGEDYDLRNYAHTRDDDESASESEFESESDGSDVEKQAIDFEEQEDEGDEQALREDGDMDEDEDAENKHEAEVDDQEDEVGSDTDEYIQKPRRSPAGMSEEFTGSGDGESVDAEHGYDDEESDEEGEDQDLDEEDSDEESEEEYDEDEADDNAQQERIPNDPKEPVFIDLLSDSEDDDQQDEEEEHNAAVEPLRPEGAGIQLVETLPSTQGGASQVETVEQPLEEEDAGDQVEDPDDKVEQGGLEGQASGNMAVEAMESGLEEPGATDTQNAEEKPDAGEMAGAEEKEGAEEREDVEAIADAEEKEDAEAIADTKEHGGEDAMDVDDEEAQPAAGAEISNADAEAASEDEVMQDELAVEAEEDESTAKTSDAEHDGELQRSENVTPEQTETDHPTTEQPEVDMKDPVQADDAEESAGQTSSEEVQDAEPISESIQKSTEVPEVSPKNQQHPTPVQTQALEKSNVMEQDQKEQDDDDDPAAAETQIMSELREYGSPDVKGHAAERAQKEASEESQQAQEPDVLITVKSLRSHSHRKRRRSDSTSSQIDDPSLLLAQASPLAETELASAKQELAAAEQLTDPEPESRQEPEPVPEEAPASPSFLRVTRSTQSEQADPSILLAKASVETPTKPDEPAIPPVRVTRSMTENSETEERKTSSPAETRASKRLTTPEPGQPLGQEQEVLESPSVPGSFVEDESLSALKRQLGKDLRTKLPDYLSLRSLRASLNKITDILAVATSTPPLPNRPKHGPRDYMLELTLTDPSSAPTGVTVGHIFRPHQTSLPTVRKGDVVLLRRVQVVSMKGRGFGVRATDASTWAVFEKDDAEMLAQIKGAPVEVTDEDVEYASGLRKWWDALDEKALGKIEKTTQKLSQAQV